MSPNKEGLISKVLDQGPANHPVPNSVDIKGLMVSSRWYLGCRRVGVVLELS